MSDGRGVGVGREVEGAGAAGSEADRGEAGAGVRGVPVRSADAEPGRGLLEEDGDARGARRGVEVEVNRFRPAEMPPTLIEYMGVDL